jgi:hypothetical protein
MLENNAVKDACEVITRNWSGVKVRARYSQGQEDTQPKVAEKK